MLRSDRSLRCAFAASTAAEALVWSVLFFAPLALGSAPGWALPPLVAAAVAAGLLALLAAPEGSGPTLPLLAAVPALAAALCLLQLLPLPAALLGLLSPGAREVQEFALVPLGLTSARPISLDPSQTWRELSKHLAYLSILVTSAQLSRSRRARRRLLSAVALAGTVVAAIGLGHLLLDARSLFGLHAFSVLPPILTPFGNPNHLAGYLTLAATAALGLALSAPDRPKALPWAVAFVAMGACALLSLSRGGIVFFTFAQVLLAALLLRQKAVAAAPSSRPGRRPPWLRLSGAALAGALAVLAVGSYVAFDRLQRELETADSLEKLRQSKVELYPSLLQAAGHFWVSGMGRGSFEAGFTRFQTLHPQATFTHPESVLLQLACEFGAVATLALLVLGGWALLELLRRDGLGVADLAVLAATLALLLHDLFDFSLELPACAFTAWVMLGTVSRPEEGSSARPWTRRWRLAALGVPALALLALLPGSRTAAEAERSLSERIAAGAPLSEVRPLALSLIDAHPSNHLLYDLAGSAYAATDPAEALAFVNRALFLRPLDAPAHRIAARSLVRLGKRTQALLEFRLAAQSARNFALLDEALPLAKGLEQLRMLTAPEPAPIADLVRRLRVRGRGVEAREVLTWALEELEARTDTEGLWLIEADFRREMGDFPAALAAYDQADRRRAGMVPSALGRAGVLLQLGQKEESLALLQSTAVRHPADVAAGFALARQLLAFRKPHQAREALARLGPFLRSMDQRAQLSLLEGSTFEAEARFAKALQSYQSAGRLQPGLAGHQYQVARMYEQLGKYPEAVQAVRAALRLGGAKEAGEAWISRLEKKEQDRLLESDRKLLEGETP